MSIKKSVIIRYSPGFANSLMEFCAGYALARKLGGRQIVEDVGQCQNSGFGYIVDEFNIPNYVKMTYNTKDVNHIGQTCIESIPEDLKEDALIIDKSVFWGLDHMEKLEKEDHNLYLCDFFLSFPLYYSEYWDEIRTMLKPRKQSENIEAFKKLISDKISVGVHIRRTDMLHADFAISTSDDFYKAAVAYMRKKLGKRVLFCIFSDDIEYAKKLLGNSSDIRYIHFLSYDDADMEEFVCLSLCNHRILSTSSTYGEMADLINWKATRITMYQGNMDSSHIEHFDKRISQIKRKLRYFVLKSFFKHHFTHTKNEDGYRKNRLYFDQYDIKKYLSEFNAGEKTRHITMEYMERKFEIGNMVEAKRFLKEIRELELDYYYIEVKKEIGIRLLKFEALYILGSYDKALLLADSIWGWETGNVDFKIKYAEILSECGMKKESLLMLREFLFPIKFIVFPEVESEYSSSLSGIGEVAVGLAKMGVEVSIVENPKNDIESIYIKENDYLTNRHGVMLGCRQYLLDDVITKGKSYFITSQRNEFLTRCPNGRVYVLSRDKNIAEKRVADVMYIFADYRDKSDSEKYASEQRYGTCDSACIDDYDRVDYILTCDEEYYSRMGRDKKSLIVYNGRTNQYPYWKCEERWKLIYNHRISDRTVNICESLADTIMF